MQEATSSILTCPSSVGMICSNHLIGVFPIRLTDLSSGSSDLPLRISNPSLSFRFHSAWSFLCRSSSFVTSAFIFLTISSRKLVSKIFPIRLAIFWWDGAGSLVNCLPFRSLGFGRTANIRFATDSSYTVSHRGLFFVGA